MLDPLLAEGIPGFVPGSRATLMLDVVALAMVAILPVMFWSIAQAKKGRHLLHRRMQLGLGTVLLVAVILFEVDMRLNGWRHLAAESSMIKFVEVVIWIHLFFAVTTAVLWVWVIVWSMRRYTPGLGFAPEYAAVHRRWARLAALDMTLTAVTGWLFYVLAFVF